VLDGDASDVRDLLMAHPGLDQAIKDTLEAGQSMKMLDAPHMATLRRLIGEAKSAPYAHALVGELESGLDKIVVFGHHTNVLTGVFNTLVKHGTARRHDHRQHVGEGADSDPGQLRIRSCVPLRHLQHQGGRCRHRPVHLGRSRHARKRLGALDELPGAYAHPGPAADAPDDRCGS